MLVTVRCDCGENVKIESDHAARRLRWSGKFGYGQHVTDQRAFVMRWLTVEHHWIYVGGRLAKSTLTMLCPKCRLKLPGLPVDPDETGGK
jgi:hypothetical protein